MMLQQTQGMALSPPRWIFGTLLNASPPLRILVDVDGVLADFVGEVLYKAAAAGKPHYGEDVNSLDLVQAFPEDPEIYNRCHHKGFCAGLMPYDGAPRFVTQLRELGIIQAVTAPYKPIPTWKQERTEWLRRFGIANVLFTSEKGPVFGDVMIEDSPDHLCSWHRDGRLAILIDRPWNRKACGPFHRATSYRQVLEMVRRWTR